jgi:predicted Zn-dependent protease
VAYGEKHGWLPAAAFREPQKGVDYAGLLDSREGVAVSSVDLTAATKGAFAATYAAFHKANNQAVGEIDAVQVDPERLRELAAELSPVPGRGPATRLPRRSFENTIVVRPDAERLLGQALVARVATNGLVQDPAVVAYVNAVAALVGARSDRYDITYRVGILDDESVNGFGLPGGYILVSKGLLDELENEAELACILGHEIAHVSLYHGLREFQKRSTHRKSDKAFAELRTAVGDTSEEALEADLSRIADQAYLKIMGGRARADELEADLYGAAYAASAGYDPSAMLDVFQRVDRKYPGGDAFRHHPPAYARHAALREKIALYGLPVRGTRRLPLRFSQTLEAPAQ